MDGINGIEVARNLRQRQEDTVLIFITGIKEYVFDALDLYAFHEHEIPRGGEGCARPKNGCR